MVTGGSEAVVREAAVGGFNSAKALSERNDDPKTASRPYDKDRDGFVMGEGCRYIVIETLDHALAAGRTYLLRTCRWWRYCRCIPHYCPASGRTGCKKCYAGYS